MNWPVFIGTWLFFAGLSAVAGFIPALWVATVLLAAIVGFLYGVGLTHRKQRGDDAPTISTTKHTQGEG